MFTIQLWRGSLLVLSLWTAPEVGNKKARDLSHGSSTTYSTYLFSISLGSQIKLVCKRKSDRIAVRNHSDLNWAQLPSQLSINDSFYSCVFFFLTGFHFFHLVLGLLLISLFYWSSSFSSLILISSSKDYILHIIFYL